MAGDGGLYDHLCLEAVSIFGYKFGSSTAYLEFRDKVVVLDNKTIGWDKV